MTNDPVLDLLRALPPDLPARPDRFDLVRTRVRRHRRRRAAGAAALAMLVVAGGTSAAVALRHETGGTGDTGDPAGRSDVATEPGVPSTPVPGAPRVTTLAAPVTTTGTGRETVELGARPAGANTVSTSLTCLSAGTVRWPDGASMTCDQTEVQDGASSPGTYDLPLEQGQTTLLIRADPGTSWRLVSTYARTVPTDWGVNADGLTYGAINDRGTPDLVSVVATDRRTGYAYADHLDHPFGPDPTSPADALAQQQAHADQSVAVPVYTSDGHTRISTFVIEPGHAATVAPSTQPSTQP